MLGRAIRVVLLGRAALGWLLIPMAAAALMLAGSGLAERETGSVPEVTLPFTPPPGGDYSAWRSQADAVDASPAATAAAALPSPVGMDLSERPGPQLDDSLKHSAAVMPLLPPTSTPLPANAAPGDVAPVISAPQIDQPSPTSPPPANQPPPPAADPPTEVPPTAVPPTLAPPTALPPTVAPPTAVPPTAIPPTAVPPTPVPPTAAPPTPVPPTAVPPTNPPLPPPTEPPAPTAVAEVTLCHRPPGNPDKAKTLVVQPGDVAGHLAHGDSLGPCP